MKNENEVNVEARLYDAQVPSYLTGPESRKQAILAARKRFNDAMSVAIARTQHNASALTSPGDQMDAEDVPNAWAEGDPTPHGWNHFQKLLMAGERNDDDTAQFTMKQAEELAMWVFRIAYFDASAKIPATEYACKLLGITR